MKLLAVKPHRQWQDDSTHHYKLGIHTYEDSGQEMDPDYHILAEVERKHAEKKQLERWRDGSEIRFIVDGRKPLRHNNRF